MKIKPVHKRNLEEALELAYRVFSEFEGPKVPEAGRKAFFDAIHDKEYLDSLTLLGAYEGKRLLGVIAARDEGAHLALFFVEGSCQGQGIGRQLWNAVLEETKAPVITVHSSLYALEIYKKLGFSPTGQMQEEGGHSICPHGVQGIAQ